MMKHYCNILIVDDEQDHLKIAEHIISHEGHRVYTACDGETALELIANNNIDMIFMDIYLPGTDGINTLNVIRENKKISHIPVIAWTAAEFPGGKEHLMTIGFDDCIFKPMDNSVFSKMIWEWYVLRRCA